MLEPRDRLKRETNTAGGTSSHLFEVHKPSTPNVPEQEQSRLLLHAKKLLRSVNMVNSLLFLSLVCSLGHDRANRDSGEGPVCLVRNQHKRNHKQIRVPTLLKVLERNHCSYVRGSVLSSEESEIAKSAVFTSF